MASKQQNIDVLPAVPQIDQSLYPKLILSQRSDHMITFRTPNRIWKAQEEAAAKIIYNLLSDKRVWCAITEGEFEAGFTRYNVSISWGAVHLGLKSLVTNKYIECFKVGDTVYYSATQLFATTFHSGEIGFISK